jgi:hypothetical protein
MNVFSKDENRTFISGLGGKLISSWRDKDYIFRMYKTDEGLVLSLGPIATVVGTIYVTDLLEDIDVNAHGFSERTRLKIVEAMLS